MKAGADVDATPNFNPAKAVAPGVVVTAGAGAEVVDAVDDIPNVNPLKAAVTPVLETGVDETTGAAVDVTGVAGIPNFNPLKAVAPVAGAGVVVVADVVIAGIPNLIPPNGVVPVTGV